MNMYYYLAIIFTVVAMIFGYLGSDKSSNETEGRITDSINKNIGISEDAKSNTDELTAKGSYPNAVIDGGDPNGNVGVNVYLKGKYAIKDLIVQIIDIPDYTHVSGLDTRILGMDMTPTRRTYPTYKIESLRSQEFQTFLVPAMHKETAIILRFKSDNKSWTQTIRLEINGNHRKIFSVNNDDNENKTLEKFLTPDFPKTSDGKLILWSNEIKSFDEI